MMAQPALQGAMPESPAGISSMSENMKFASRDSLVLRINEMDEKSRAHINEMAEVVRNGDRSVLGDIGKSMLSGGMTSLVTVVLDEIINFTKIRSVQKRKWQDMRNKECIFVDSLESLRGQCDFYGKSSDYGPLDPADMNFGGFTFSSNRDGKEVLLMVCSIDTSRLDQLFNHSKFSLVLDSLVFYPYRSYLPNLPAINIGAKPGKGGKTKIKDEDLEYYETIRMFSYDEYEEPTINIRMDISSSWINELVQVYQDVKLGSFSLNIPVPMASLSDTVFIYSRREALAANKKLIELNGESFIVPRSYMPGRIDSPSWGTGEYKMKVTLTQKARYKQDGKRARNWHKDYARLVRLQNGGRAAGDYWKALQTTLIDKSGMIMKSTYTPLVNYGVRAATGTSGSSQTAGAPKM